MDTEEIAQPLLPLDTEAEFIREINPEIGEYWKVKNGKKGKNFLYSIIVNLDPLEVRFFSLSSQGKSHKLDDESWPIFEGDLDEKITPPKIEEKGRKIEGKIRQYYHFN